MATLLLSGAPGAENYGSMDRPKQNIPDRIKLEMVHVHPLFSAVQVILDHVDPHLDSSKQLNIHARKLNRK